MVFSQIYQIDLENSETHDNANEPTEVNEGLWVQSLKGNYIKCKRWRLSEGRFRFLLDGKVVLGPGIPFWIYLVIFIVASTIVFMIFEVAPYVHHQWYMLAGGLVVFCCVSAVFTVLRVVLRDPGYIPIPSPIERLQNIMKYRAANQINHKEIKKVQSLQCKQEDGFCRKCDSFRPYRTSHCDVCNACVERMDHHFSMFGTCIGRRNYGSFYLFLVYANALTSIGAFVSLTNLISSWIEEGFIVAISRSPTFFLIMSAMVFPPLGLYMNLYLLIVHTRLVAADVTLYEKEKGAKGFLIGVTWREKVNSCIKNFKTIVFATSPPSQLYPQEIVTAIAIRRN